MSDNLSCEGGFGFFVDKRALRSLFLSTVFWGRSFGVCSLGSFEGLTESLIAIF